MRLSPVPARTTGGSSSRGAVVGRLLALTNQPLLANLVWVGLLAGTLVVAYAYAYAATVFTGQLHFHLFWIGMLLFTVPACLRLCSAEVPRAERLAILMAVGLFDYLPKFLRSPSFPLFHDELAHWRQAEVIFSTGKLFQPNPTIGIIQFFPGLHALTAALRDMTGLQTFQIGTILLALLHLTALMGIFVIAERMTNSAQIAGIAAFIYSLNPSFMYFDTQYSYESLAIVFLIWVVVCIFNVQDAEGERPRQVAWFISGLVLAGACIITHHLSSYAMAGILVLIAIVTALRALRGQESRETALFTGAFTGLVLLGTLAWLIFIASDVVGYLSPSITGGVGEVLRLINHEQTSRTLFVGSTTPSYERLFAFLAPVIAAAGAAVGLWLLRRQRPRTSAAYALFLFGLLYFPSVPFMLTQSGNEGARRSWAFSYIGLCLLVAPVIPWLVRRIASWRPPQRGGVLAGVAVLFGIVLIGNVTAHMDEEYRFPGPFVYGSDTRSLTPELLGTTAWFKATEGTGQYMVTDRYSGLAFASFGKDWTAAASQGFPVWELYFNTTRPSNHLLTELRDSNYQYLIVDKRISKDLPKIGVYIEPSEPDAYLRSTPPSVAAVTKFNKAPWAVKVYATDNLDIYRFDYTAVPVIWALNTPPKAISFGPARHP